MFLSWWHTGNKESRSLEETGPPWHWATNQPCHHTPFTSRAHCCKTPPSQAPLTKCWHSQTLPLPERCPRLRRWNCSWAISNPKDDAVKVLHSMCQQIWKTQDWKRSVFIPIPKKGNGKERSNYCTIAFISHASKVMLKILQASLQQNVNHFLLDLLN